jgi:hypothetical protein
MDRMRSLAREGEGKINAAVIEPWTEVGVDS